MLAFSVLDRGRRVTVRARAKVNLGLEVLGRRADGYHELLTLLSAIHLADRVTLEAAAEGVEVDCDAPDVPSRHDNSAWRAADLLCRQVGIRGGVRIRIRKAIPVAAGLGGGSADAAAVLIGLDRMWGLSLSRARLHTLATELGMDVPFFLGDGPALGSGRGEELAPVPRIRPLALVLVNPAFPLPTREVYEAVRPGDLSAGREIRALVDALPGGAAAVAARLTNGLEAVVARRWPELASVKAALTRAGALGTVMSGSGPTVVGIARSPAAARAIRGGLAAYPWRTWVTRTVAGPALSIIDRGPTPTRDTSRAGAWGVAKR